MAATNWSERIPAAIAKGEELTAGQDFAHRHIWAERKDVYFTAGEVALARALWRSMDSQKIATIESEGYVWEPPTALIAYCEKVERLSHD